MPHSEIDYRAHPILVVDDDRDNLDTILHNFRKVFDLQVAQSGEEGLAILKNLDAAVVLSDQKLSQKKIPLASGVEFLQAARQVRPEAV